MSVPCLLVGGWSAYLISFDARFLWIGLDILYILVIYCSNACIDIASNELTLHWTILTVYNVVVSISVDL